MNYINDFFAVREAMNAAFRQNDLEKIKTDFVNWMHQQCISYSKMNDEERELTQSIPALDSTLKMKFFWPENFAAEMKYKGMIAVVTHELSRTGAPLVLLDAVRLMKRAGYFVLLFSPEDGVMRDDFLQAGLPVMIGEYIRWLDKASENPECCRFGEIFEAMISGTDLLFCNTVVTYPVIKKFIGCNLPIFWWIHEGKMVLDQVKENLPQSLSKQIHVFFVSEYSQKAFSNSGFCYENSNIMPYGIDDICQAEIQTDHEKIKFLTVGTISERKGQDVLIQAIQELDEETGEKCQFTFVGKELDSPVYEQLCRAAQINTSVEYRNEMDHEALLEMMKSADCVICPSRDDAMPVVATEGFALEKTVICSDHTGTAGYIEKGQNGFVFQNENVMELKEQICYVSRLSKEEREQIGKHARSIFEGHFTREIFEEAFLENLEKLTDEKEYDFAYTTGMASDVTLYQQQRLVQLNNMYMQLKNDMRKQGDEAYRDGMYLHGVIKEKEEKILDYETEIKDLKTEAAICREEAEILRKSKESLEIQIQSLKNREEELEKRIHDIYNSKSWKITEPLRKAGKIWGEKSES